MNDKVVCKKRYKDFGVGDIVQVVLRDRILSMPGFGVLTDNLREMIRLDIINPIAGIYLPDEKIWQFIYYDDFSEHFCTVREYRKLKLKRINESNL